MNTKLLDSLVEIIHSLTEDEQKTLLEKLLNSVPNEQAEKSPLTDLENESFVGMWQDREELANSSQWVRQLRRQEWGG
ncbi:hypothetical protein [Cyanothece sp. BG0011]|uniref:hypothetical protein n=1 Tax=Cyanothece sp. BG0011 TaxID=2082950 RepID=UPI0018E505A4|nr:hypothetical protein [Cyanothece sp. BG0011]